MADGEIKLYFNHGSGIYYLGFNKNGMSGVKVIKFAVYGIKDKSYIMLSGLVNSDDPLIIDTANKITSGLSDLKDKVKALHDFVVNTVEYNSDEDNLTMENEKNSVQVLLTKKGVCRHYSYLFAALARAVGIPTRTVVGIAGGGHEWNEVYIDGQWLALDTTWDDQSQGVIYDYYLKPDLLYHYKIPEPYVYIFGETYGGFAVKYLEGLDK
ncbi:transglutaminase domain-containing protein [Carboxydothermus hydrogenoformans]|uniref:Transglutaminase family protein n=1 Tax=Carboxydothermus hydrogenoformans (strain ATCC BAA-161 / DSM 6008 / Z-2901) TaxID=246194 RepID=Q3A975_CARHZ|nr:transglutaminase-like domain-containing protein [Carboxydothermus hydrogenoformans]ABB14528.1 transglutaminase family protein [Carboxydothermus hydrogenoformans Z-2901]